MLNSFVNKSHRSSAGLLLVLFSQESGLFMKSVYNENDQQTEDKNPRP